MSWWDTGILSCIGQRLWLAWPNVGYVDNLEYWYFNVSFYTPVEYNNLKHISMSCDQRRPEVAAIFVVVMIGFNSMTLLLLIFKLQVSFFFVHFDDFKKKFLESDDGGGLCCCGSKEISDSDKLEILAVLSLVAVFCLLGAVTIYPFVTDWNLKGLAFLVQVSCRWGFVLGILCAPQLAVDEGILSVHWLGTTAAPITMAWLEIWIFFDKGQSTTPICKSVELEELYLARNWTLFV